MTQKFIKILAVLFISFLIGNAGVINSQVLNWSPLGSSTVNGTNGDVYAITTYNGNIVVAGGFTNAGGIAARNIAMWNGVTWSQLGSGIGSASGGDTVYALAVYNGDLYAAGNFSTAGGSPANNIARWTGTYWYALGSGTNSEVRALIVYNSKLYVGGEFDIAGSISANRVARLNGLVWEDVGGGFSTNGGSKVFTFTKFGVKLIAGGRYSTAGGHAALNVALWNDTTWSGVGDGVGTGSDRVFNLVVNNNILYAGGKSDDVSNIAQFNGTNWVTVGGGMDKDVNSLISYKGKLIASGNFKFAGGVYVDRIAQWDGVSWTRLLTGMNEKVYSLFADISGSDTILYAGGEFTTAGGKIAKHVAKWSVEASSSVAGTVKYSDNNLPVATGTAKILRRDISTQEVIVVDSANVTNGSYLLPQVPRDADLKIVIFPNDEFDFVPTYFPSTVNWANATPLFPTGNLTNINVNVFRIDTTGRNGNLGIGGSAFLNFVPAALQPGTFPYNKDAIVYLKQGSVYKGFGVSNMTQQYNIPHIAPGTYDALVYRIGYEHESKQVNIGSVSLDTVNFYLDTSTVAEVHNISTVIPDKFQLEQNYPNPFNPVTKIKFSLTKASFTGITVYNSLGQEVARLVNEFLQPGVYEVTFNAASLPSGMYFYKLSANSFTETRKMILVK